MHPQDSIDQKRAEEYLDQLLMTSSDPSNPLSGTGGTDSSEVEEEPEDRPLSSASSVSRKRAEWALTKMYETDAEFRRSVDSLVPNVSPNQSCRLNEASADIYCVWTLRVSNFVALPFQAPELLLEEKLGAVLVHQLRGAMSREGSDVQDEEANGEDSS